MYFILVINGEMGVDCGKLHSLSVAGIILLFINPYTIYDYGFILSFVAVAGILLFANKIVPEKESVVPFFYKALSAVGVCIAAFSSTALFQCAWFGQLPLFSVITSSIVCFIFSCVFVVVLACMLLAFLFPNVIVFNAVTDFFSLGFIEIVRILESVPPLKVGKIPLYVGFTLLLSAFSSFYIAAPIYSYIRRKIAFNKLKK
jgi:competence protein ComEC